MPVTVTPSRMAAVDSFVKAFEAAWYRDGGASVGKFLPAKGDPLYRKVARELVCVDLELGWDCGRPPTLEHYRATCPDLFGDAELLKVIAFEEFRQRREHGESPDPDDYARRYGVNTDNWPGREAPETPDELEATALTNCDRGMEAASIAYRRYRANHRNNGACAFDAIDPRTGVFPDVIDLFRAVHSADPEAAQNLAEATIAMPEAGSHFLGFRLSAELGRGAFGRVFLAYQGDLADRPVALKISADLHNESQTLAQLQHTNIVPIYSVHRAGYFHAVCMPYFGSTTLADVLSSVRQESALPASGKYLVSTLNGRKHSTRASDSKRSEDSTDTPAALSEPNGSRLSAASAATPGARLRNADLEKLAQQSYVNAVLTLTARLADGLAHAHERGIMHRDLKPANVLLTDDGQPMLLDFNLSQDTKLGGAAAARIGGTLPYMAPEHMEAFQRGSGPLDARADIFSLGLIVFELLTGKFPYPARRGPLPQSLPLMVMDRREAPPRLGPHNPAVTPAVEAIVRHCLMGEPHERYLSARELQEDLERHLADLPLRHAPEPSSKERLRKWVRRHPRLTSSTTVGAIAAGILLACAGSAAVFWYKHKASLAAAEHEQQRLAAVEQLQQFRLLRHQQQTLLNDSDLAAVRKVIDLARTGLAAYDLPHISTWQKSPLVRHLPAEEQQQLRQDVAEVLLTWADAERQIAEGESDPLRQSEQLTRAWHLTERAEECMDGRESQTLWRQRATLADLLGRDDADELAQKADDTLPNTAGDHFFQAREYLRQREFKRAVPHLQEVTRQDPGHFWAWFLLGNCYTELLQFPEAITCYSACTMNPDRSVAYFPYSHRARVYYVWGRINLAEADLALAEERLADLPSDLQPRERLRTLLQKAKLLEKKKDFAGAERVLTDALDLKVNPVEVYLQRARVRDKLENRRSAQEDRDEAIGQQPTDEVGWNHRGLAQMAKNPRAALNDFDKALTINPRFYPALQNKAYVLVEKLNRPAEALEVLNRTIEMYPGYVQARVGRGVVLARQGKRKEAHADAIESLARDRSAPTYYQAANIYALTSRQEPADREWVIPLLGAALCNGFGLDVVDDDHDMDPVRDQYAFQRLVAIVRQLQGEVVNRAP